MATSSSDLLRESNRQHGEHLFQQLVERITDTHRLVLKRYDKERYALGQVWLTYEMDGVLAFVTVNARYNYIGTRKGVHTFRICDSLGPVRRIVDKLEQIAKTFADEVATEQRARENAARNREREHAYDAIIEQLGADDVLTAYPSGICINGLDGRRVTPEQAKRLVEVLVELGIPVKTPEKSSTADES